ncbi:MAG: T9SS type A sorting domain-containing protein [Candidatus Marinimicrobia bacterium]|nr:T9SS type A sorting domain-containing protein [Candidatus Neomarinimicrobiota bacterium]
MKMVLSFILLSLAWASDFSNNGATITIDSLLTVSSNGSFENNGTLINDGTFHFSEDFVNNGEFESGLGSNVSLIGDSQSFPGIFYANLIIDGEGTKLLQSNATVNGNLTLTIGTINLQGNTLNINGEIILGEGNIIGEGNVFNNSIDIYNCTDSIAVNFDENAIFDDGSCLYPPTASVDETPVDFGNVPFNNQYSISKNIDNTGDYLLEISASIIHPNLSVMPESLNIPAGESGSVIISVNSLVEEMEISDNLVINTNDPYNLEIIVPITSTIVPLVHPIIIAISDVPNDQGGRVKVQFTRSYHDTDSLRNPEIYSIERLDENQWVAVQQSLAYGEYSYVVEASTYSDMIISGEDTTFNNNIFRIIAGMEEGNFVSEVAQGYSVDNIDPIEPENLMVTSSGGNNITLDWSANLDDDLAGYNVYRQGNKINESILNNSQYNDALEVSESTVYSVKAMDVHGNESSSSEILVHNLDFGNNLISIPTTLDDNSSQNMLNEIIDDGTNVVFILGQGVGLFNTVDGWSGNLNNLFPTSGNWLNIDGAYHWDIKYNSPIENCYEYITEFGNNLLSYRWGSGSSNTLEALGGEEFATENFNFILGQGLGLFNTPDGWSGNLNNLEEGKGYWVNISNGSIDFKWGMDNCAEPTESSVLAKIESTIPQEYRVNQSTQQAFYLIKELIIDGKYPVAEDLILAYHNNILVGSTNYSELTVLPIMGRDLSEQTIGFIDAGQVPQLKLLKANGELVDLHADIEPFSNLLVSEVQSVTGSTIVIPTEFVLHPAYPNPFNPVTTISFGVPNVETGHTVSLQVFDINGRLIETLIDGQIETGFHTIEWNAEGYPSGVYFVKLDASEFTQTQKLMLVK